MPHLQLSALLRFCLERRASPDSFHALLKQLNHKQEVTQQSVEALLSSDEAFDPLLVVYISTVALADQTTSFKFSNIVSALRLATESNQYLILNAFATELRNEKDQSNIVFNSLELNENVQCLFSYLKYLLDQKQDSAAKLYQSFCNLLIVLLPELIQASSSVTPEQIDLLTTFIVENRTKSDSLSDELDEILAKITNRNSISGSLRQTISTNPSINGYNSHSAFLKTNKLPKFIWLNSAILDWKTHEANFLSLFDQFLKVKTKRNTLNELLAISFEGYVIAAQSKTPRSYFIGNWKLFILKRLPLLIKELNLKNPESSLLNAIHLIDPKVIQNIKLLGNDSPSSDSNFDDMFSSFPSTTTDIRHDFLKSCIALSLLPPSSFKAILHEDAAAAADGRSLPTSDDVYDENGLAVDFKETLGRSLIDINTEFIPLEDSGLLEFLKLINNMEGSKQREVSQLILSTILTFIKEDDKLHLYRIALALGLSTDSLDVIVFHVSPRAFLKPLMSFLDNTQSDSEEINFQDSYSAFGCVFLLFLLLVKRFDISLNELISYQEQITQDSFCIKYLTNLGSSRQLFQTHTTKHEILNNWMTALFDSGGISDDLMRLSTVQECFEILPSIFQQAFIGYKQNLVDLDTVKGGLEYFLQPFLLGTIVGFLAWSENYLWRNQDVDVVVNLLKTLLSPLDISGESVFIHKIILSNFTNGLYKILRKLDTSSTGTKIDPVFFLKLRQASEKDISSPGFFQLEIDDSGNSTYTNAALSFKSDESSGFSGSKRFENSSLLESFHNKFNVLLNWSQSSTIPFIDYSSLIILTEVLGVDKIVDYFVSQITSSQSLNNGKTSQLLIEASSFFLVATFTDIDPKTRALKCLKKEIISDEPVGHISKCDRLVSYLVNRKKNCIELGIDMENDVFLLFYDRIIEDIEAIHMLS